MQHGSVEGQQTIHHSRYTNFMNVDLLVTFVMWLHGGC